MKLKQRPVTVQAEKVWVEHHHITGWTNHAVFYLVGFVAALAVGLTRLLLQPSW